MSRKLKRRILSQSSLKKFYFNQVSLLKKIKLFNLEKDIDDEKQEKEILF